MKKKPPLSSLSPRINLQQLDHKDVLTWRRSNRTKWSQELGERRRPHDEEVRLGYRQAECDGFHCTAGSSQRETSLGNWITQSCVSWVNPLTSDAKYLQQRSRFVLIGDRTVYRRSKGWSMILCRYAGKFNLQSKLRCYKLICRIWAMLCIYRCFSIRAVEVLNMIWIVMLNIK